MGYTDTPNEHEEPDYTGEYPDNWLDVLDGSREELRWLLDWCHEESNERIAIHASAALRAVRNLIAELENEKMTEAPPDYNT